MNKLRQPKFKIGDLVYDEEYCYYMSQIIPGIITCIIEYDEPKLEHAYGIHWFSSAIETVRSESELELYLGENDVST